MKKPNGSILKSTILYAVELCIALAGTCFNARAQQVFTITISGTNGTYSALQTPPGALTKATHDRVIWQNNSDSDMLVCMKDGVGRRAFLSNFFHVPKGAGASSGPLRAKAQGTDANHPNGAEHQYYLSSDPPDKPIEDCPTKASTNSPGTSSPNTNIVGPKVIIVK